MQIKYYIAAISCGLLVFAYCIIFDFKKQYIVSITAVVNMPGAMPNGKPLHLSEIDTSKVNPYNRLKGDIHDLQEFQYDPAYQTHSLSIEPGTRFYNSLDVSLSTLTFREGQVLLYRLINLYNSSFRKKHPGQQFLSGNFSDQLEQVSRQFSFLNYFSSGVPNEKRLRRAAETLTTLSYYITQPVTQFSLIPNTFNLEDQRIAALILLFNELQAKKQHLISNDKNNMDGLALLNKQLYTLQLQMIELIRNDQLMIGRLLNMIGSDKNKAYTEFKDSLLMVYAKLIQIKAKANLNIRSTGRLLMVNKPQVTDDHWPLIKAVTISAIAAISLLLALVIGSQIGLDNINTKFSSDDNIKKRLLLEPSNTAVNRLSTKSGRVDIEAIANAIRNQALNGNVFLFSAFAGIHDQLSVELSVAMMLSSKNKTVVWVNTDFSQKTTVSDWMGLSGVGVRNFIADETVAVASLPQIGAGYLNTSFISLGELTVSDQLQRKTELTATPFLNSNPDVFIHHPRLTLLIDILRSKYHYILLHASPLTNAADVVPFSNAADHSMLLVQKGRLSVSASSKIEAWETAGHLNDILLVEV